MIEKNDLLGVVRNKLSSFSLYHISLYDRKPAARHGFPLFLWACLLEISHQPVLIMRRIFSGGSALRWRRDFVMLFLEGIAQDFI